MDRLKVVAERNVALNDGLHTLYAREQSCSTRLASLQEFQTIQIQRKQLLLRNFDQISKSACVLSRQIAVKDSGRAIKQQLHLHSLDIDDYNLLMAALSRVLFAGFESPVYGRAVSYIPSPDRNAKREAAFAAYSGGVVDGDYYIWSKGVAADLEQRLGILIRDVDEDCTSLLQSVWRLHLLSRALDSAAEIVWQAKGGHGAIIWPGLAVDGEYCPPIQTDCGKE